LSSFGPYYGDATSSLTAFRRTLETMADLPARAWVTSHHKGVVTEREEFLRLLHAFREKIDRRERAILDALAGEPRSLDGLVAHRFLYPPGYDDIYIEEAERNTLMQHL